jgi:hypothetical protein
MNRSLMTSHNTMNHVATLKANEHELCHSLMTSHNTMNHIATKSSSLEHDVLTMNSVTTLMAPRNIEGCRDDAPLALHTPASFTAPGTDESALPMWLRVGVTAEAVVEAQPWKPTRFVPGMRVEARYGGYEHWFPAVLGQMVRPDKSMDVNATSKQRARAGPTEFEVNYDDGDYESNVRASLLRVNPADVDATGGGHGAVLCAEAAIKRNVLQWD